MAITPERLNGVYGGSKAFVLAFSQSLRQELEGRNVHVQVVLPGATATDFWDAAGLPVAHLPQEIVMPADALVDAALLGLSRKEFVTIPSLHDIAQWDAYEAARQAMAGNLSTNQPPAISPAELHEGVPTCRRSSTPAPPTRRAAATARRAVPTVVSM
ncbi:short-subunit dehydrogenase [Rhizobium giardinii]|uniref:Short-subunit dehydrogenase n=1 Tax=Rhizobium giardinii TaxID=56731 RepID=A0A7W8UGP5_9HYPH|nr:short-subunit dehydrogenase [Rhizobium giardinii]